MVNLIVSQDTEPRLTRFYLAVIEKFGQLTAID